MHRFFTAPDNISEKTIRLMYENVKHIEVLRLKRDELFCVCDGSGTDYICKLISSDRYSANCEIIERSKTPEESKYSITLFQGMPKGDKFELIIQKCVELGIDRIVPVTTTNTIVRLNSGTQNKIERYCKISEAAARQCSRKTIPGVTEPVSFKKAVEMLSSMDEAYTAYEKCTDQSLKAAFENANKHENEKIDVGFFVGPEGGFTENEITLCADAKIEIVSLGKRILRTETAGFVMLMAFMYSHGEL